MDQSKYREIGLPVKETYKEKVLKLTGQIYAIIIKEYRNYGYADENVFDALETIIKEQIEANRIFECSQENMEKKIMAVHDMSVAAHSLFIGPYPAYRETVLEKLAEKITALTYTIDLREEIIDIMFAVFLKEMKLRFSRKKSGYSFIGVEGIRNEGVIRVK